MNLSPPATAVAEYYDQTDVTYQNWGKSGAYELHYGYHELPPSQPTPRHSTRDEHVAALQRMNHVMAKAVGAGPDDRVLDAGCGVGASSFWLAEHRGCRVHGISLSEVQIEKALHFASIDRRPKEQLDFSRRDFTDTGFESGTFDVVWALESLCHAEHKGDFLREAHRLLRPGGRLVIADSFLIRSPAAKIESHSLDRWLSGWAIPGLITREELLDGYDACGFTATGAVDITENIRPSAEEIYRRGHEGYPSDILSKGKNVVQIQHVEACLFQKVCLDLGLWRYQIHTAVKR